MLQKESRNEVYSDIWGILKNKKCHPYLINGVEDHLHIVTHVHPTVSLSTLVKDIKLGSNSFIQDKRLFSEFPGWQEGYAAFTYTIKEKKRLIRYVQNQEAHHKKMTFKEELISLLQAHEVEYDEKYLL